MDPEEVEVKKSGTKKWLIGAAIGTTSLLIIGLCVGLIPEWGETEINSNDTTTAIISSTLPVTTIGTVPLFNSSLVLALQYDNRAMVIDFNGKFDENINFKFDEGVSTFGACPVMFQNEFFLFGGTGANSKMVSKVNIEGCALERQSTDLTFELSHASCGSFNIPLAENATAQNVALLCFSVASYPDTVKQCHWFDGSEYGLLEEMTFQDYVFTSPTLPSYMGLPFIVGGIIGHYAELFTDFAQISGDNKYRWYPMVEYPFASKIFKYTTTSIDDSVYFIGGLSYEAKFSSDIIPSPTVAKYRNKMWSRITPLMVSRHSASAITIKSQTLVIGGSHTFNETSDTREPITTELWELNSDTWPAPQFQIEPHLIDFFNPALFSGLPNNFCGAQLK